MIFDNCSAIKFLYSIIYGSSVGVKKRISSHKSDMSRGAGKDCGFCEHWATFHRGQLQDFSMLKIYFLDSCEDPGRRDESRGSF